VRRRPRVRVLTLAMSLAAFQVLAVIGAGTASAVTGCTYDPSNGRISITIDPGQFAGVAVETAAADLDSESPPGAILFDNNGVGFEDGANTTQCGSATNSNTTQIVVLGSPGNDEYFYIDNGNWNGGAAFNTSIAWAIDMGSNTAGGYDEVDVAGSDGNVADTLVVTDTAFSFNGGGGSLLGVEVFYGDGGGGNDVLDGSGAVNMVTWLWGEGGNDWIALGAVAGPTAFGQSDYGNGGAGTDQLSYGHRTTCTVIDEPGGIAGHDANCDGDLADAADEVDFHDDFEIFETGTADDVLIGDGDNETFIPGDGDDVIDGGGGFDWLDYSSSSAGMVIDPNEGTATGQGNDEFTSIEAFVGSNFDDTLIYEGGVVGFCAGSGVDTVDASAEVVGALIDIPSYEVDCDNAELENAIGGSGNDVILGNVLGNRLFGGDGHDWIEGGLGNDWIEGGPGNDQLFGDAGADTLSYVNAPSGVTVDNQLGFASGGDGEDAIAFFEIVRGSDFGDTIIGGQSSVDFNNRFFGRGGNDLLIGTNSTDVLVGGPGRDELRGAGGDDILRGGAGNDLLIGGRGDDILRGGRGRDTLVGGPGFDVCIGGPGRDRYRGCEVRR
jgi:hypothetical protein